MSNLTENTIQACPCCDVQVGRYHRPGCGIELCPYCGNPLVMCIECDGCPEAGDSPWPPAPDDRAVWDGELLGVKECQEFGFYCKEADGSWAFGDEPDATKDFNRLFIETEWDRGSKRRVRTSFMEAFNDMGEEGIMTARGCPCMNRKELAATLNEEALELLADGLEINGYAFCTWDEYMKRRCGLDFILHLGKIKHPEPGEMSIDTWEVADIVADCLAKNGIKYHRNMNRPKRIKVSADSIVNLPVMPDYDSFERIRE